MSKIENTNILEFVMFCVDGVAERLGIASDHAYAMIKESILDSYILPNFDVLHTQGKEYIVEDLLNALREKGVIA